MPFFRNRTAVLIVVLQFICLPVCAKVVSIIEAAADYTSVGGNGASRSQNNNKYKEPDPRCESFAGLLSAVPENQECDETSPLPGVTCYRNCRCAYGTSAACTCDSRRYFSPDNLPFGTEPAGKTCKTKTGAVYHTVRCKSGFVPDAGAKTCTCTYGGQDGCLCNSLEYPLLPGDFFDYETYNYTKCEHGNFYKKSGCKKTGYDLIGNRCVPHCAKGFSASITTCGEVHKLVEQEGFPVCKKCERITCPPPYTFVNDCPDGTTVSVHPQQAGCFKCDGTPCSGRYQTYNVCRRGQTRKMQPDNAACVLCEGEPCQSDYAPDVFCADGQVAIKQESNPLCQKCSGTSCAAGYALRSSCEDGQTILTQSNNPQCKKCSGTPCLSGYSTKIGTCADGRVLKIQRDNPRCRKCDSPD